MPVSPRGRGESSASGDSWVRRALGVAGLVYVVIEVSGALGA